MYSEDFYTECARRCSQKDSSLKGRPVVPVEESRHTTRNDKTDNRSHRIVGLDLNKVADPSLRRMLLHLCGVVGDRQLRLSAGGHDIVADQRRRAPSGTRRILNHQLPIAGVLEGDDILDLLLDRRSRCDIQ